MIFISCLLFVTVRWVQEVGFHCLGPLMLVKCHLSKGKIIRVRFLKVKQRSGSGNDYRSSSPMRGKGPEDLSVSLGP